MATTKIKKIYETVISSIYYITNREKTENGKFTEYYMCGKNPLEAANDFEQTRLMGYGKSSILGQHIIQSFAHGEVTPEQAFEIGKELAQRFLKGEYQYVLCTHIDRDHIHNHIVVCGTNMVNYKSFATNEDRDKNAWKNLRKCSDNICREKNISVIKPQDITGERGASYYEWLSKNNQISWKQKLKTIINAVILKSENFGDFLSKMRSLGVEIEYKPQNEIKLKYRLNGQQKFTRARTLGPPYDVDGVTSRIEKFHKFYDKKPFTFSYTGLIDTSTECMEENENLKRWANIQNMKLIADTMIELEKFGVHNLSQLSVTIYENIQKRKELIEHSNDLKQDYEQEKTLLTATEEFLKYRDVNRELKELSGKPLGKKKADKYAKEHADELKAYYNAKGILDNYNLGGKLPDLQILQVKVEQKERQYKLYNEQRQTVERKLSELSSMQKKVIEYLGKDVDKSKEIEYTRDKQFEIETR